MLRLSWLIPGKALTLLGQRFWHSLPFPNHLSRSTQLSESQARSLGRRWTQTHFLVLLLGWFLGSSNSVALENYSIKVISRILRKDGWLPWVTNHLLSPPTGSGFPWRLPLETMAFWRDSVVISLSQYRFSETFRFWLPWSDLCQNLFVRPAGVQTREVIGTFLPCHVPTLKPIPSLLCGYCCDCTLYIKRFLY